MGWQPYWYTVPYQADVNAALQKLRQREFQAGRYFPATRRPEFPIINDSPAPGPAHKSIEEAIVCTPETGTRSILDILGVSQEAGPCCASAIFDEHLLELFGTTQPDANMLENDGFRHFRYIEPGQAIYMVLYKLGQPDALFFAGYAFG